MALSSATRRATVGSYTAASPADRAPQDPTFVGTSAALRAALRLIDHFAPHDSLPVLIEGESGTGKSYAARALHLRSPRAAHVFHQVILSALDDNLAASDLFGHLSGAYTDARQSRPGHFVSANGGSLFLDEIGKASLAVQRKLLHAVEHHEVWPVGADRAVRLNVRVVAASNVPLEELAARGLFLPDLAARLTNFRIRLPALRDRREDIPALVQQFLAIRAPRCGYTHGAPSISDPLLRALQHADWPYNLRQLDAVLLRLLIEADGADTLGLEHCRDDLGYLRHLRPCTPEKAGPLTREVIESALARAGGNVSRAAALLGVDRTTLHRKRRLFALEREVPIAAGEIADQAARQRELRAAN
jgi:DNA-binding NtrC family response regulator